VQTFNRAGRHKDLSSFRLQDSHCKVPCACEMTSRTTVPGRSSLHGQHEYSFRENEMKLAFTEAIPRSSSPPVAFYILNRFVAFCNLTKIERSLYLSSTPMEFKLPNAKSEIMRYLRSCWDYWEIDIGSFTFLEFDYRGELLASVAISHGGFCGVGHSSLNHRYYPTIGCIQRPCISTTTSTCSQN
jgi:hypothetical protein